MNRTRVPGVHSPLYRGLNLLVLLIVLLPAVAMAQLMELKSSGLPAASPEMQLPANAVVHVHLTGIEPLLDDANALFMSACPQQLLPPDAQPALSQPNPLVALLTTRGAGEMMQSAQIQAMLGIDFRRPITFSLYTPFDQPSFILSIPMADPVKLTALLMNTLKPQAFEPVQLEGGSAFRLQTQTPNLPPLLYIVCSDDRAYLCGSEVLAQRLFTSPPQMRLMPQSAMVRGAMEKLDPGSNLLIVLDTMPLRPMLAEMAIRSQLPPGLIRRSLTPGAVSMMKEPGMRMAVQRQLQRIGVVDVNQAIEYLDAAGSATYQVLFEWLVGQLTALQGGTVSIDLGGSRQVMQVRLHSSAIDPAQFAQPAPMNKVIDAMEQVPSRSDFMSVNGRTPVAAPSQLQVRWFDALETALRQRKLSVTAVQAFRRYCEVTPPVAALESRTAWTARTVVRTSSLQPPDQFKSMGDYVDYLLWDPSAHMINPTLTILADSSPKLIPAHFEEAAEAVRKEIQATQGLRQQLHMQPASLDRAAGVDVTAVAPDMTQTVYWTSYATRFGLFGYSQHALINRRILLSRPVGSVTFIHEGASDPTFLQSIDGKTRHPLSAASRELLKAAPKDAFAVESLRWLHQVNGLAQLLESAEALMHRDMQRYLNEAVAAVQAAKSDGDAMERLLAIETPVTMDRLMLDRNRREFFLTFPGDLGFPRPRIMPEVRKLLTDFEQSADQFGGVVSYQRVEPGMWEATMVQDTRLLGLLIKSVGNRIAADYVNSPDGAGRAAAVLRSPYDELAKTSQPVIINPTWQMLHPPNMQQP